VLTEARHYAGILTVDADPNRIFAITQKEVDNFNGLWCAVFDLVLEDCQQFYSAEELGLITGGDNLPLGLTPEGIEGRWNIALEIDARDLNMDFVMKKLESASSLMALDSQGTLDRTQVPAWGATALFPGMAGRMIQPVATVTQKLIDEEQGNVAKMAVGIEPRMPEDGIDAPQTRMQAMTETVGNSPRLAQLYQQDPGFRELLANRQKFLTQQYAQQVTNKQAGRLGTKPLQGNGDGAMATGAAEMGGGMGGGGAGMMGGGGMMK